MRRFHVLLPLFLIIGSCWAALPPASKPASTASRLENTFAGGWIVQDSNGDGVNDVVHAQLVVPSQPSAVENAAAADVAARIGYETAGMTLPIVFTAADASPTGKNFEVSPKIWIGINAVPADEAKRLPSIATQLASGEGGWFAVGSNLAIIGSDPVGLLTAAAAYASRAPYQWTVQGDKIEAIAKTINEALQNRHVDAKVELAGITYVDGQSGIRRAVLQVTGSADLGDVRKALSGEEKPVRFGAVHELYFIASTGTPLSVFNPSPITTAPLPTAPEAAGEQLKLVDLGALYTIKGLLGGSPKKPIPSSVAAQLYVPAGPAGVAMANLAARIGLETTGITLPLAFPADGVSSAQVHSSIVLAGDSLLSRHVTDLLTAAPGSDLDKAGLTQVGAKLDNTQAPALAPGEGELRVVDGAFGKNAAIIARGDAEGSAAAVSYAASHLPNLWEYGKQYESTDEMRYDLHRFFSLRSGVGQASAAMYHLDRWMTRLAGEKEHPNHYSEVEADVYVDKADPGLDAFVKRTVEQRLKAAKVTVHVGSLHAGMKCCDSDPDLHYRDVSGRPFHQAKPTFAEDLTIPWEGTRLIAAVKKALAQSKPGDAFNIEARVSEGPEQRDKLSGQIRAMMQSAGADMDKSHIVVLCAYKQGYSWIMDQVAPDLLKLTPAPARVVISFAPYRDKDRMSAMGSPSRWVQELYPVDEVLAKTLGMRLDKIELAKLADESGPTYRVAAYSDAGAQVYTKDFKVSAVMRPYSPTFPNYDRVTVETGWLHAEDNGRVVADERIATDLEEFWDHYQNETLPRIYKYIVAQNDGKPRQEYQPLFDTLKISFHMSEPDYDIGLDQERISSLEALQEDTLFSTENFFYLLGSSESNGIMDYMGRVIPVAYPTRDGQDGTVRIEFYAKDVAHPLVRLRYKKDGATAFDELERDLPAVSVGSPRLIAARVQAGQPEVKDLTWRLLADARNDDFQQWKKVAAEERIERSMLSVEQAQGEVRWLEAMHGAGLYRDNLEYPHLAKLSMEFELPLELGAPEHAKADVVSVAWVVQPPATKRPMIADVTPAPVGADGKFVSWDEPIGTGGSERLLARLAKYPGVDVYWMGRSYLGQNIWAADVMEPSPSQMRSMAKETTLKAAIIYSGRQHANEVSSTSHILKLAEQLVTDPATRDELKQVNVVLHPITNPDGTDLAMDLAKITPENMLHPGYHASLTADMVTAQWDEDPIYPESRTRRQLWEAWLPDAFLNPHGYPSHEWVQPFSEYAAWVINRYGAENGRAWWIARGWFTSLNYLRDEEHPHSMDVTYALRDHIAAAMAKAPGVLEMNKVMNARYERFGQKWDEKAFQQPIFHGVRVYMALKGEKPSPRSPSFLARFPDVTWDDGYTEAPDETAHGDWLHLVASAGLAFDRTHLDYLAGAKFKIKRTQKEFFNGVNWKVDRERPVLPGKPPAPADMEVAE